MADMSMDFEEICEFINGIGSCTTIIGSREGGPRLDTATATALSTTLLSPTLTSTSSTSSPTPKTASPPPTGSSPSPPSTSPMAAATSDSPIPETLPPGLPNPSSPPLTSSRGTASATSTIKIGSNSTTTKPNTSIINTDISAADSLSATPSTSSPHSSTSPIALPTPASSSTPGRFPTGAIAAIAISIGGILFVLVLGYWYAERRRRQAPAVVVSSPSPGSNADAHLSEATLISTTRHTLLPHEDESEKMKYSPRGSLSDMRESTIVQGPNFVPLSRSHDRNPSSRFLESVPFLTTPSVLVKGSPGARSVGTASTTASSASDRGMEATEATEASAAEMEGGVRRHGDFWERGGYQDGEGGSISGVRSFRYETDGGIRLAGGPPEEVQYEDDDQRATVLTLPPPYSQY